MASRSNGQQSGGRPPPDGSRQRRPPTDRQHSRRPPPKKFQDEIISPINQSIRLNESEYQQKLQRFASIKNPVKKADDDGSDKLLSLLQSLAGEELWKQVAEFHRTSQVLKEVSYVVYSGKWDELTNVNKRDYTHYRYTPIVSGDADEFEYDGYKLRYQKDGSTIKLLVGITVYNEEFKDLEQTILGVCECIEHLHQKNLVNWWEVVLCIVQDGVSKMHSSVPAAMEQLGLFSEEVLYDKNKLGERTTAHMFEYTLRIRKEDDTIFPPLQAIFLTKTENRGKLSSHTWLFKTVAQNLNPEHVVLFDAGTRPYPSSLSYIYKFFSRNPGIGACCGELEVEKPFSNGLLASIQYLEWKFSYIMEIPFYHLCGFLTVLPGAFSAYRWEAIQGVPLKKYFEGFYQELVMSPFYRNVYLAEDRVLCMEIVAKKNCNYRLGYVKQAVARADTPTTLKALLKQRRRWLNGTFFAMIYDFMNFYRIWTQSSHNFFRKCVLTLEFLYLMIVTLVNSWLGIGIVFVFCFMLIFQLIPIFKIWFFFLKDVSQEIAWIMLFIYVFFLLLELITSLNNKPDYSVGWHWISSLVFLGYTVIFTALTFWYVIDNIMMAVSKHDISLVRPSIYLLLIMTGAVVATVAIHGQFKALLLAGIPYYLFTNAYINVLQVYAFCNTHDISWGTKDLNKLSEGSKDASESDNIGLAGKVDYRLRVEHRRKKQKIPTWEEAEKVILHREAVLKRFSTYFILTWVTSNLIIIFLVFYIAYLTNTTNSKSTNFFSIYVEVIFIGISALRLFQVVASLIYVFKHYLAVLSRKKYFQVSYGPVTEQTLNPPFLIKLNTQDSQNGPQLSHNLSRKVGVYSDTARANSQPSKPEDPLLKPRSSDDTKNIEMTEQGAMPADSLGIINEEGLNRSGIMEQQDQRLQRTYNKNQSRLQQDKPDARYNKDQPGRTDLIKQQRNTSSTLDQDGPVSPQNAMQKRNPVQRELPQFNALSSNSIQEAPPANSYLNVTGAGYHNQRSMDNSINRGNTMDKRTDNSNYDPNFTNTRHDNHEPKNSDITAQQLNSSAPYLQESHSIIKPFPMAQGPQYDQHNQPQSQYITGKGTPSVSYNRNSSSTSGLPNLQSGSYSAWSNPNATAGDEGNTTINESDFEQRYNRIKQEQQNYLQNSPQQVQQLNKTSSFGSNNMSLTHQLTSSSGNNQNFALPPQNSLQAGSIKSQPESLELLQQKFQQMQSQEVGLQQDKQDYATNQRNKGSDRYNQNNNSHLSDIREQ